MNPITELKNTKLEEKGALWIGKSALLESTQHKLESIAHSRLPVLIQGKTGTGKRLAARTIHHHNKGETPPFIVVCCKTLDTEHLLQVVVASRIKAKGGTLLIENIDKLSQDNSQTLKDFWLHSDNQDDQVRLIASCSDLKPKDKDQESHFMDWLHYYCLTIELPNLKDRAEDIPDLVAHYQDRDPNLTRLSFQPDAWAVLKHYPWPGNVKQLKHCLEKLAAQVILPEIGEQALLDCFPSMANKQSHETHQESQSHTRPNNDNHSQHFDSAPYFITQLNQAVPTGEQALAKMNHHPALDKAIVYLYNHFAEPVSMAKLANHACVSGSHLSYLFKQYLGISFKQTLLRLRIVKAMELLSDNPNRQVTQICDDVGFSDLSFFVRKFKATVGMSPGVYRDRYGHAEASQELRQVQAALADTLQCLSKGGSKAF